VNERALFTADRWFRTLGAGAIMALGATGILLFAEGNAWRVIFVVAHLAALLALLPLGVVLVLRAYHQSGGLTSMVQRYPVVTVLLVCLLVTIVASLLNFDGNREARRVANLGSVALILVLVVRYLRWARTPRD
jgi:cytochrome bd-type quinol oxidase subunit 2